MKYLEWNNIIAATFFNSKNAGKDVYLYITKEDIIKRVKTVYGEMQDEDIWKDFFISIKKGIPGSKGNILEKAKYAYSKTKLITTRKQDGKPLEIDGVPLIYPPYISYLTLLVLPLIEGVNDINQRANNYYGRLNLFLQNNELNEDIGTNDFRDNQINALWEDLANWANIRNNGDLGIFNVTPFTNQNWIYVGKVFSQCILPPKFLNRLPELFETIGLVPNTKYDNQFIKDKIKNSKTDLIPKNVLDFLKKDDEISNSIIQTIQRQYRTWTGETHQVIEEGFYQNKKRNYTVAPLFLQIKINNNDEEIYFSYRMYSSNDYPEDLKFDKYENIYETNGWSKTISVNFREGIELKDRFNKWVAKFRQTDVRLFINAANFQLSNDFWIETEILSRTEKMYLLCKNEKQEQIKEWGKTFEKENFCQIIYEGIPSGYSLFYFQKPKVGHPEIEILKLYSEKRIELVEGLKVNFRTYLSDELPKVDVINSDGYEKVFIQYRNSTEKIFLSKVELNINRWLLPNDIHLNEDFYIKIEDEYFLQNELAFNIVSSNNTAIKVNGYNLPRRDCFGRICTTEEDQYCLGSNIIKPNKLTQLPYAHKFRSVNVDIASNNTSAKFDKHSGNNLCSYLSLKSQLSTEEYFRAFEYFYLKEFSNTQNNSDYNLTKLKKVSLNIYDYIGILDYDYETKNIVLNPTQFIFIPASKGRKVLLIGARDSALIESIISTAPKYNLQVDISKQLLSNKNLLLPDIITVSAFKQSDEDLYGENSLNDFANQLNIKFTPDYYPQVALQDFSANINQYENTLQKTDDKDYDWARYIFNPITLEFEKSETELIDKTFSLIRYKLNEYTYHFKLWKNNICYQVDVNWGRFIALKYYNKNVILFDKGKNIVAIPVETPLPRLLSESIMLLSGKAPDYKDIEGKKYRVYENVIGIFTQNLFKSKLEQTAISKEL